MARATRVVALENLDFRTLIHSNDWVIWGQAASEPLALTRRLLAQRQEVSAFNAFIGISWSDSTEPSLTDRVSFTSYCGTANNRRLGARLDILPVHYSQLAATLGTRTPVLLLQLAGGLEDSEFSFGAAADYVADLLPRARLVVAQVNPQAPRTHGASVARAAIDLLVPHAEPLATSPAASSGDTERAIARHVASLIEDGAVLQLGLGALPIAVLSALNRHRDLGIHSGLIVDAVADLTEAGVITNARKRIDRGQSVAGLLAGGPRLMAWAHDNAALLVRPTSYTHNPDVLARHERFVALNSALEVDLSGQINAEVAAGRYVGAVGGGADFLRGARRSPGGLPIVALSATAGAASRIVRTLSGPVSTSRADAGLIVTENGVADLRGATLRQRRERLIAIAAPEHRAALDATP